MTPSPLASATAERPRTSLRVVLDYGLTSMVGIMALHGLELIDMFWVARLGPEAVAAVALFVPVYMIFVSVNGFVGTGSVTLISRAYGRGDATATAEMIRQNLNAKFVVGTAAGLLGLALLPWCLGRLGAEVQVTAMSRTYGTVLLPALGFTLTKYTCFTALRCAGRPRLAMTLMLAAMVLNAALDPLLIFGGGPVPALGLRGAALASICASLTSLAAGLVILATGVAGPRVRFGDHRLVERDTMRVLARVGIPQGANNLARALAQTVIMGMVTPYGTATVAAFGVAQRLMRTGVDLAAGFGLGLSSLVGQSLGAARPDHARQQLRHAARVTFAALLVLAVAAIAAAPVLSGLFFSDPALAALGAAVLRVLVLAMPLLGAGLVMNGVFSGAGYTLVPTLVRQGAVWLVQMPLIWIAARVLGAEAAWIWRLIVAGAAVQLAGQVWLYRRHGWERWPEDEVRREPAASGAAGRPGTLCAAAAIDPDCTPRGR